MVNEQNFEAMIHTALSGARYIVTIEQAQLLPVVMLWGEQGLNVVGIEDTHPRDSVGVLRGIARGCRAEAAVAVVEALATVGDSALADVAVVYAIWPARNQIRLITFDVTDHEFEPCNCEVEDGLLSWLDEVLT